jgi:hypothetical protein
LPGGYVYRGEAGRQGWGGKLFYGLLLASQFIPSLLTLRTARPQRAGSSQAAAGANLQNEVPPRPYNQ